MAIIDDYLKKKMANLNCYDRLGSFRLVDDIRYVVFILRLEELYCLLSDYLIICRSLFDAAE